MPGGVWTGWNVKRKTKNWVGENFELRYDLSAAASEEPTEAMVRVQAPGTSQHGFRTLKDGQS